MLLLRNLFQYKHSFLIIFVAPRFIQICGRTMIIANCIGSVDCSFEPMGDNWIAWCSKICFVAKSLRWKSQLTTRNLSQLCSFLGRNMAGGRHGSINLRKHLHTRDSRLQKQLSKLMKEKKCDNENFEVVYVKIPDY